MKKINWLCIVLILICLAGFWGYRTLDQQRTDTTAPKIQMDAQILQVSVQDPTSALLQGVTASDDTDGDVTGSLVVESIRMADSDGTVNVRYAAFDKAGNVAKAVRQVRYTDYKRPKFSLSSPLLFPLNTNFNVLTLIQAEDALDGDISHLIRATSLAETSIAALGTHQVQFRVTNSLGDLVELVLPVEVYASGTYAARVTLTDYLIYLDAGADFDPADYLADYTWNNTVTSLRDGLPEHFSLHTEGAVDTQTPGVYSVSYEVSYTRVNEANPANDQTYTGYTRLIVVVEG